MHRTSRSNNFHTQKSGKTPRSPSPLECSFNLSVYEWESRIAEKQLAAERDARSGNVRRPCAPVPGASLNTLLLALPIGSFVNEGKKRPPGQSNRARPILASFFRAARFFPRVFPTV